MWIHPLLSRAQAETSMILGIKGDLGENPFLSYFSFLQAST